MKLLNLLQGMRTSAPIVPPTTPAIRAPTLDITFVTKVNAYIIFLKCVKSGANSTRFEKSEFFPTCVNIGHIKAIYGNDS